MNTTTATPGNHEMSSPAPSYLALLLRRELAGGASWYRAFGILWLIGLWIVPIFSHPLFFLWIGLILVFLFTPGQTGVDVLDGTEEFTFTQPPTRADVFLSRMIPGTVFLLATGLIGVLAVGFDLPQKMWSLVFSGGITTPFRPVKEVHWYPLAVLIPVAAHTITGGFGALAITRQQVLWAGLFGVIGAWALAGIGLAIEKGMADRLNGWVSTPLLVVATAGIFAFSFRAYQSKEATRAGAAAPLASRGNRWPWIVLLIVVAVILFLSLFWVNSAEVNSEVREARKVERLRIDEAKRIRNTEAGSN